jgi:hypothetical protein
MGSLLCMVSEPIAPMTRHVAKPNRIARFILAPSAKRAPRVWSGSQQQMETPRGGLVAPTARQAYSAAARRALEASGLNAYRACCPSQHGITSRVVCHRPDLLWVYERALLARADLGRSLHDRSCLVLPKFLHTSVRRCFSRRQVSEFNRDSPRDGPVLRTGRFGHLFSSPSDFKLR